MRTKTFPRPALLRIFAIIALTLAPVLAPFGVAQITAERPAPLKVDAAALSAITTQKYPDADSVIVDNAIRTRYAADGTAVTYDDTLIKVLTEKGLRDNRTHDFSYNVFYENLAVVLAQILRADGTVSSIDVVANSKDMIDRSQMGSNIYDPNDKILTLATPGLKIGDTLQIIVERTIKRPRMKDNFTGWENFEWTHPILHRSYEVRGPKNKPLRAIALLDKSGTTVTHTEREVTNPGGTTDIVHTWEAANIPQAFPEPSMPALYISVQRLLIGTVATWEDVSKWYYGLCEPHLAPTQEIRDKVAELIATPATDAATPASSKPALASDIPQSAISNPKSTAPLTDDEKIRKIFRFVSQEIRYMGITLEKDSPGYEPHDVSITFNNRYGVCRDKAALLVTMLRVAGFDASPVLINVGPLVDKEVPYSRFNHAITGVRRPDGTYTLMDSTNETTYDLLPAYLYNKSYIVARAEGDTLQVSPVASPEKNMLRAETQLTIADDGAVTGNVTLNFSGINDDTFRRWLAQAKPEDIRRWLESSVKDKIPGAILTAHEITPRNRMETTPLRITFAFSATDYFTVAQNKTVLETPWFGTNFSYAAAYLGNGTGLAKRRFPLEIPYTCGFDETLTINLPPRIGETLALPDNTRIELPSMTFDKTFTRASADARVITGKLSMRLRAPLVEAGDEYAQLKTALKDIEYSGRQSPVLAAKPKVALAPDIRTLSDNLTITLTDAHNWTRQRAIKKQILTYAGKKDNAELHLNYNPVWETMTLDSATVTLKDGSTRTVSPTEINIMDAAWVASAPRYPAGKTMVVSLPGVEEGATIDYSISSTYKNQTWFTLGQSYFGFDPVDNYTFTLNVPKTVALETSPDLTDALTGTGGRSSATPQPPTTTTANSATVSQSSTLQKDTHTYRVTGTRAGAPREGGLPPVSYLGPVYEATTVKNAADYARLINTVVAPLAAPTDTIRKKATELTASAQTDTERITAIRDFVARHIRNAGPNFTDLPFSCLSPAERTLTDAYGNQADRAILLSALLTAAGLQPELLLTAHPDAEFYMTDRDIFNPDIFSGLVVRVAADFGVCYLDQLSIYADPHASSLENCMVIPLATGKIETIKLNPAYQTRGEMHCDIKLAANGDATITYTEPHHGTNHANLKRMFKEMTPEELTRFHQGRMTWISQAATPNGDIVTNLKYPATITFSANVPRYAVRSGDYLYFQLPSASTSPTPAGADTREYPLFATDRHNNTTTWTITLPPNVEIESAPENLTWKGPDSYGTVKIKTNTTHITTEGATTLEITQSINLTPAVIPAASYSTLLEINRRLSQPSQWRVLLKVK